MAIRRISFKFAKYLHFHVIAWLARLKRLNFTHIGVDGMKRGADVNTSVRSTAAREMNYAIGIHGICWVRSGAPVAVTPLYIRVISRPYRGRFTTAPGPRSVLGTSRSHHRKARKSAWFYRATIIDLASGRLFSRQSHCGVGPPMCREFFSPFPDRTIPVVIERAN